MIIRKLFTLTFIFTIFSLNCYTQPYYQRIIGGANNDYFRMGRQTSDGGSILIGYTASFGMGSNDFFIVKTDISGDTIWVKTIGDTGWESGYDVIEIIGLGYLAVGETNSTTSGDLDILLVMLDGAGNVIWSKTYGGTGVDEAIRVRQSLDGGFIIGGYTLSFGSGVQYYLIKTDNTGVVSWSSTYGGAGDDYFYCVNPTADGGYIMSGETHSFGAGNADVLVIKVDALGNEEWTNTYGMALNDYGYSIEQTSDLGYIVGGASNSSGAGSWDAMLMKLDAAGTINWVHSIGSTSSDYGWEAHETSDGGFMLAAQENYMGYGQSDAMLVKTDASGNFDWAKIYTGTLKDYFLSGTLTIDNGFLFAGYSQSFGATGYDAYYVRTDSVGFAFGCYSLDVSPSYNNPAFVQTAQTILTATGFTDVNQTFVSAYTNSSEALVCPCSFNHTLVVDSVLCYGGNDGAASVSVSGGTTPYNYFWSTLSVNDTIDTLIAGDYYVIVTDFYGCTIADTASIGEPAEMNDTIIATHVLCFGGNDGEAVVQPGGGVGPYSYLWSTFAIDDTATGLAAGWYYLTISDDHLCTRLDSIEITQPVELFIDSVEGFDALCFGDSTGYAIGYASGGTPLYYYDWSNSDTLDTALNLPYGWVYLTVTDDHGCFKDDSIFIDQPTAISDSIIAYNVLCYGDSNGWAVTIPGGGTAPYTYYWSQTSVTDTISDLLPGTYYLTITDDHLCTYLDSAIIGEPTLLEFSVDITDVSCNGFSDGEATALPTGGIGPYTYIWSNGDTTVTSVGLPANTYFVTVYDNNLCSAIDSIKIQQPTQLLDSMSSVEATCYGFSDGEAAVFAFGGTPPYYYDWSTTDTVSSVTGLIAGWYYITVTDTNSCVITDSIEVIQPSLLVVADSIWDVLCYGDSTGVIFMNVTGGTPPYTYTWFDGSSGSIHDSLPEGKYHVSVTDANGCFHLQTNIVVNQPFDLVINLNFISPLCFGYADGSISTTVSGGVIPYQYFWSDSSTNANHTGTTAGFYGVTVTDVNGCTERDTITVTEPDLLVILDSTYVFQYEGFIDLDIAGGTFPYEYNWSNEETTEDLTGLISGTYQVTVTDFNGCIAEGEYIIDIPFVIPSLFTPNGDGFNDTWEITNLKAYADLSIQMFNRWGDLVYEFEGSGFEYDDNRWDGTYNVSKLPMGSYVYIIDLKNGNTPYCGTVMLKY